LLCILLRPIITLPTGLSTVQYIFYHRADPAQVGLYGRPPNATNDALWARAVRENPDPGRCVGAFLPSSSAAAAATARRAGAPGYDARAGRREHRKSFECGLVRCDAGAEGVAMRFECECVSRPRLHLARIWRLLLL
jgi:hypothetical protein